MKLSKHDLFFTIEMIMEVYKVQNRSADHIKEFGRQIATMKFPWLMSTYRFKKMMRNLLLRLDVENINYFGHIGCKDDESIIDREFITAFYRIYMGACTRVPLYRLASQLVTSSDGFISNVKFDGLTENEVLLLEETNVIVRKIERELKTPISDRDIRICSALAREGATNQTLFFEEVSKRLN